MSLSSVRSETALRSRLFSSSRSFRRFTARLSLELVDLVRGRLTRRVAGEPFLARLQELLRPTVLQVLIDPFLAAQLSNAVLATQAFQYDADLLFSGMMPACGSANIPDCLFSAFRYALARLPHHCSSAGYDEPAILSYAISSFCPTSADGLQIKRALPCSQSFQPSDQCQLLARSDGSHFDVGWSLSERSRHARSCGPDRLGSA